MVLRARICGLRFSDPNDIQKAQDLADLTSKTSPVYTPYSFLYNGAGGFEPANPCG
ncbi:MAG: hypothetical protein ABSD42_11315 [Candidatus Bathyarchaeia archaeon]